LPYSPLAALQFQHNTWYPGEKFNVIERLIDLNTDRKRLWFQQLNDVNDGMMIDSMPISLNYIIKSQV